MHVYIYMYVRTTSESVYLGNREIRRPIGFNCNHYNSRWFADVAEIPTVTAEVYNLRARSWCGAPFEKFPPTTFATKLQLSSFSFSAFVWERSAVFSGAKTHATRTSGNASGNLSHRVQRRERERENQRGFNEWEKEYRSPPRTRIIPSFVMPTRSYDTVIRRLTKM